MPPPWLSREIIYPIHERLSGRPTTAMLAQLEKSQWLPRSEVEELQRRGLARLMRCALLHSPWHAARIRAAGIEEAASRDRLTFEHLRRLPTMSRNDARVNVGQIRWTGVPGGAHAYNTGGSSGEPLSFYIGRSRQASDAAGRIRARRWWGVDFGEREVYLWGAPIELNKTDRIKRVRDRLLNQIILNAFEMSESSMKRYLDIIRSFRPVCIYGYASSLALLAAYALTRNMTRPSGRLRMIFATGEPLYPHQRTLINSAFGVPVANEFGSRDIGFTAHEAPHGQMLLMSESIVLEVLDSRGEAVPAGQAGEAVVTGLWSDAQPFVRYRTGDIVRIDEEPSRDGRGLHVIRDVVGRSTDFIVRSDGTVMHALAVIYVMRSVAGIAEFKVVQHALDQFEVLIVAGEGWSESRQREVSHGLAVRLGASARISIRVVDEITPAASGKHRYVVSHVRLPEGLGEHFMESPL